MSITTAQAFTAYLDSLTPTPYQTDVLIPSRRRFVDERLTARFGGASVAPFTGVTLIGSAAKRTNIRPIDDIDLLATFSTATGAWGRYARDSQSFLYLIRNAFDDIVTQQVGARGQAVRIFYDNGGHLDIAPVLPTISPGVYKLPAGDGSWIDTAPTVARDWYSGRNTATGYHLSPLVRLLKAWNRAHSRHFRSFHLETMAASMLTTLSSNHRANLAQFWQAAPYWLDVRDPGGQSGALSTYWTAAGRQAAITAVNSAAERAGRALQAEQRGDHVEANRLWRVQLGDTFPTS